MHKRATYSWLVLGKFLTPFARERRYASTKQAVLGNNSFPSKRMLVSRRRHGGAPVVAFAFLLFVSFNSARATWPFSEVESPASQCIDSWDGDEPQNVSAADDGRLCFDGFCWKNEPLKVLPNVVRAYADEKATSIKTSFDRRFLEHLFSSMVQKVKVGGGVIRKEDEPYAAVLALVLSRPTVSKKGITYDQMMTAVDISEKWIYEPYPRVLGVRGVAGHHAVPTGDFELQMEGDDVGKASYMSRNVSAEYHIGWDAKTKCWGLWMVKIKQNNKKKKGSHSDGQRHERFEKQQQGNGKGEVGPSIAVEKAYENNTQNDKISRGDVDVTHGEDHGGGEKESKTECKRGVCQGKPLYKNCDNSDLVPTKGWKSTKTITMQSLHVWPLRCAGTLTVVMFQQRTGSNIQWALLRETDGSKLVRGRSLGYLVFRGTADVHDILTDLSIAKVHWLKDEGASWGVWSSIHSEVRSSISAIRRAVSRSGIKTLIVTGHSLGGGYAQEAARLLKQSHRRVGIKIVVFGSPTIFARREAPHCDGAHSQLWAPWDEVWPTIGVADFGGGHKWWGKKKRGKVCKAWGDAEFKKLDEVTTHVVNRWDLVPRVHLLPHILSQEGGKNLVPAFTRLVANRIGGYAARFGGYITDALELPRNFNRTMQSKRQTLDLYKQLGDFIIYPPGIVCSSTEISATAVLPGGENDDKRRAMGRAPFALEMVESAADQPLHALAIDHAKYRDALRSRRYVDKIVDALCETEWNVTCGHLAKRFGPVEGGALSKPQQELLEAWRERLRERQRQLEEQSRRELVDRRRADEEERRRRGSERRRGDEPAWNAWDILGASDAQVMCAWTHRWSGEEISGEEEGGELDDDLGPEEELLELSETLKRIAHPLEGGGYKGNVGGYPDEGWHVH